jgi:CCR4-NOT transcription complex subunit 1
MFFLQGWPLYHKLVLALLSFLGPILQNGHLQRASRTFYRGTLRTLLVLLHDFPEFLCAYYWSICDIVPSTCVQLRNLILSAFPRNMYLPDPYSLNLKMGELFESQQVPEIGSYQQQLSKTGLTSSLNELARTDDCQAFAEIFLKNINTADNLENGPQYSRYNIAVINPVILHLGDTDITENRDASQGHTYQICKSLLTKLDAEGCYLLLNSIANHMRFPNRHTCFFSSLMLSLFEATDDTQVKEQITR